MSGGQEREVSYWYPSCALCDWEGEGSPDQRTAFRRASYHADQEHVHQARPHPGSELYPDGWDPATGDTPDWITATCEGCSEAIEWDPRNLWSHS